MQFRKFAPLVKVDEGKREIDVLVTSEVTDLAKEKLDWESTRPHIVEYSESIRKATEAIGVEPSLGNVRLMHDPVIAGKFVSIELDDVHKQWTGTIRVKDGEPWEDVMAGHVTGVSIGGDYIKRWDDPEEKGVKRYTASISEVSLVDRPCNKDATFRAVRKSGEIEIRKFAPRDVTQTWDCRNEGCVKKHLRKDDARSCLGVLEKAAEECACCKGGGCDCQTRDAANDSCRCHADCANCQDNDCEGLAAEKVAKGAASDTAESASETADGYSYKTPEGKDQSDYHRKAQGAHVKAAEAHRAARDAAKEAGDSATARAHGRKADQHDEHASAHGKIAAAHEAASKSASGNAVKVAAREDVNPEEGKGKYGDVAFADAQNKKYPIDTEAHIRAAWNYISKPKNADKYSAKDLKTIRDKIVAAWKAKIDKDGPPSAEKATMNPVLEKCLQCVASLAYATQSIDAIADGIHCDACGAYGCNCRNCSGPRCCCCYACSQQLGAGEALSDATTAKIEESAKALFDALVLAAEDVRDADAEEETAEGATKVLDAITDGLRKAETITKIKKSLRVRNGNGSMTTTTVTKEAPVSIDTTTKKEEAKTVAPETVAKSDVCNDPINQHIHEGGVCKAEKVDPSAAPIMKAIGGLSAKLDGFSAEFAKRDEKINGIDSAITTLTKAVDYLMNRPAAPNGALRSMSVQKAAEATTPTDTTETPKPVIKAVPKYEDNGVDASIEVMKGIVSKGLQTIDVAPRGATA